MLPFCWEKGVLLLREGYKTILFGPNLAGETNMVVLIFTLPEG
jgi:hypothetical protein